MPKLIPAPRWSCDKSVKSRDAIAHVLERCRKLNAVSSKENVRCEFVYGSLELNLLHLPFLHYLKDPLEDLILYLVYRPDPTALGSIADFEYENFLLDVDRTKQTSLI
ncbi:hypothetical protein F511_21439 [Dorcoceras hygrometricum]|uniref:Uncharacterized protein n=1 Tax=Dorcoceras hygrometricum TaxID=472368 RepID=A0A2Z7CV92_9LAMI|nr:hypothetical protein F511_21439 [Dorcoceras hygrometricum]